MSHLELIAANSMFANKTNTFIGRVNGLLNPYHKEGQVQVYKPDLDTRFTTSSKIVSHDKLELPCTLVRTAQQIYEHSKQFENLTVVAVDEVQMLDHDIIPLTEYFIAKGVMILACGLTHSFRGEPFPFQLPNRFDSEEPRSSKTMGDYETYAGAIIRLTAHCMYKKGEEVCGKPADRIQRFKPKVRPREPSHYTDSLLLIGGIENYAAVCRNHHVVPGKPRPFD